MTNTAILANSQSISAHMQQGNAATIRRMKALLLDHSPKVNHHFCPPFISQADSDKSRVICKAAI